MEIKKQYDVCLISSALIESVPNPPAGVPSLVSYLKSEGYSPLALDLDSLYKKTIFAHKFFSYLESKLILTRKSKFNAPIESDANTGQNANGFKNVLKKILKGTGKHLLKQVRKCKNSSFKIQSFSLERTFEMMNDNTNFPDIEDRLWSLLKDRVGGVKVAGISVVYPDQVLYALLAAKTIKRINKDTFVVLGGSQITTYINKFAGNPGLVKFVDAFIVHEGEEGLCGLLDAVKNNKPFKDIPNLYHKYENAFKASNNVDYVMPLDKYKTPDFDGFDLTDYPEGMLPIRTLRGCYWGKCTFCSYSFTGGKFRGFTDLEFVINSIKTLQEKYKVRRFEFIDDSLPAKFLKRIAEEIIKNNLNIQWCTRANVQEEFKDIEFVKLLKKSGCASLYFGVESGSDRIMKLMKKMQLGKTTVLKVMEVVSSQNIQPVTYMMFGFPTETKVEAKESFDFFMKLKKDYKCAVSNASAFNLVPGTAVFENPGKYKITKVYTDTKKATQGYGFKYDVSEGLTREEVQKFCKKANFFLRYPFLYKFRGVFRY